VPHSNEGVQLLPECGLYILCRVQVMITSSWRHCDVWCGALMTSPLHLSVAARGRARRGGKLDRTRRT